MHRVGALVASILVAILMVAFLFPVLEYMSFPIQIFFIEWQAAEGYWTADGLKTWSPSLIAAYNAVMQAKEAFIATNDIGNFLYHCGFSVTGQIFRIVVIFTPITVLVFSLRQAYVRTKRFIKKLVPTSKKSVKSVPCRHY